MKKGMVKGISPLVAVIMLIAFTLIIAGILAVWLQQFASEQTRSLTTCADARVLIQRASYNESTEELRLSLYNYGRVSLNFTTLLKYTTEDVLNNTILSTEARTIKTFTINNVSDDLQEVVVQSIECTGAQDFLRRIDIKGLGF